MVDVLPDLRVVDAIDQVAGVVERRQRSRRRAATGLFRVAGVGDDRAHGVLVEAPAQSPLGGGIAVRQADRKVADSAPADVVRHPGEGLPHIEGLRQRGCRYVIAGAEGSLLVVPPGEQAAGDGDTRDDADTGRPRRGQDLLQWLLPETVKGDLDARDAGLVDGGERLVAGLDTDAVAVNETVRDDLVKALKTASSLKPAWAGSAAAPGAATPPRRFRGCVRSTPAGWPL